MKEKLNKIIEIVLNFIKEKRKLVIISAIALIVLIVLIIILSNIKTVGNTGNILNNLGFSVKKDGYYYYLGLKESNTDGIYRIKGNGNKSEKISSDYGIYLNKCGNYLYFLDVSLNEYNIARVKIDNGKKEEVIKEVDDGKVTIVNNWIYYYKDSNLYRAKINGDKKQIILDKLVASYNIIGNTIYYSYIEDTKYIIAKMDLKGDFISKIDSDASDKFYINNGKIYYIYENYDQEKFEYSYDLYKIDTNGKNKEKIISLFEKIEINNINICNDRIYYIKLDENNEYGIYSMDLKGKDEKLITKTNTDMIEFNVYDNIILYTDENDEGNSFMFKININGENKEML